jgi:alkylated DNA repair dioxygenase AlkB
MLQTSLFGGGRPEIVGIAPRRSDLGLGAWLEVWRGLVRGSDVLFDELRKTTEWQSGEREMYGRVVAVPRLTGRPAEPVPVVLHDVAERLRAHTGWTLDRISLAYYRDGSDSVAWHGDRMGELRDDCVLAVLSLGNPRTFRLRPAGGGPSRAIPLHGGDCVVLGGTAQRTFEHAVLKVRDAGPRIAVMFRPSAAP